MNVFKPEHWLIFQIPKLYSTVGLKWHNSQQINIFYTVNNKYEELTIPRSESDRKYKKIQKGQMFKWHSYKQPWLKN